MSKPKIKCHVGKPVFGDKDRHLGYSFETESFRMYYSLQFKRVSLALRGRGLHLSFNTNELKDVAAFISFCDGINSNAKR